MSHHVPPPKLGRRVGMRVVYRTSVHTASFPPLWKQTLPYNIHIPEPGSLGMRLAHILVSDISQMCIYRQRFN